MDKLDNPKSPEDRELGDYLLITSDGCSTPKMDRVTVREMTNDLGVVIVEDRFGQVFRTSWLHLRARSKSLHRN
jgi:hypothetical protein